MRIICAAVVIALLAQQKNANPDLKYDEAAGISIGKMPKNDEWAFRDKGFFEKSKVCVSHKVDTSGRHHPVPRRPTGGMGPEEAGRRRLRRFGAAPGVTEMKKVTSRTRASSRAGEPAAPSERTSR
jgi:hypothetical protein